MPRATIRFLHHLLLYVSDLERAESFYEALGMEPIPSLGPRIRWMSLGPNELHLMAAEESWQKFRDEPSPHFAIESSDIHASHALIPTIGGEILQEVRTRPHDGSAYFFALDPDGNRFEITQHLEDWHLRAALVEDLKRRGALRDPRIEAALRAVPRHMFLPARTLQEAYSDQAIMTKEEGRALSSCSQPSMVALMLGMLELERGHQVLEVGAGTGWNAALMTKLVGSQGRVSTIDIDEDTVAFARENLARAGVQDVHLALGDGGEGVPQNAPYDAIVVTCGASDVSPRWVEQLREGGVLVAPLWFNTAQFCGAWRKQDGALKPRETTWAGFIPLRGAFATARTGEEDGATFLFDEMHRFDPKVLRALLDTSVRAVEVDMPELRVGASAFLEYIALRGEPLLMVTLPNTSGAAFALCVSPQSLLLLEARPRIFGSDESLLRLRTLLRDWQEAGRPGTSQASITIAARGALDEEESSFLIRKSWADYRVRFDGLPSST